MTLEENLQGRIIALELFVRSQLASIVLKDADPVGELQKIKGAMLADTGHPATAYEERVMNEARKALADTFAETTKRVKAIVRERS
ncbi:MULTISPECIES: hypothetical protein [unclassified Mesorhizobium]|uniref:hypothetical protein n=1 Tax=unclassified Mesorhizobium TaxID=325217 RepID=UPI000FD87739|nr:MULTISPECIES: hypothetical protein [unclassified Mesorhizobium]TGR38014.1 hypothetical protein EN842_46440 [bacterium M00.F.Ca.ET.199.01.1.1]TGU26307.1 hypothetical protein EN799_42995 [bacterium M00.F.Ca.ET.156.01.1.1]TGV83007.1 hypothetical protein EN792_026775 [Mesorhizobium sp. M00.F.Ca.ET.149.01.1.1]TGQ81590.1 hypothetical protein EN850_12350 [Mesorhizobium sp. M8A.F.Ca.ET.207.01.1.1]TGR19281.1 hypothetical protein EN845_26565 [Mesorhizobium sp. M8A.F.Ca.ET.202.01.1.1]